MAGDTINTVSGGHVKLPLTPECRITLDDVALALARKARWLGWTDSEKEPMSVAEHSILVSVVVPLPLRLAALMHDAIECIIPDFPRPWKDRWSYLGRGIRGLEADCLATLGGILCIPPQALAPLLCTPEAVEHCGGVKEHARLGMLLHLADEWVLGWEGRDLAPANFELVRPSYEALEEFGELPERVLSPYSWRTARVYWLDTVNHKVNLARRLY